MKSNLNYKAVSILCIGLLFCFSSMAIAGEDPDRFSCVNHRCCAFCLTGLLLGGWLLGVYIDRTNFTILKVKNCVKQCGVIEIDGICKGNVSGHTLHQAVKEHCPHADLVITKTYIDHHHECLSVAQALTAVRLQCENPSRGSIEQSGHQADNSKYTAIRNRLRRHHSK